MLATDFSETHQALAPEARAEHLKQQLNSQVEQTGVDHLAWAELAEQWGEHQLAFREVQLAVRDQPDNPQALKRLGVLLLERGNSERAAQHLEAALHLMPEDLELRELLAGLYADKGQLPALQQLQEGRPDAVNGPDNLPPLPET